MCGICGIATKDEAAGRPEFARATARMAGLMQRRGPDDSGQWSDPRNHVQLGFRRLSILDLTPLGHQPMVSADGRSVLVFNGEIYNHRELRHGLEQKGIRFRSRSDSEVLLEALNLWGAAALNSLNGMFALAWYDMSKGTLLLARDHAGIKPLYYFVAPDGGGVAFASQFDVLLHTPWGLPGKVRMDVLKLFLRLHHIPPPYGLLENTYQLEPGTFLLFKPDGSLVKQPWWQIPEEPEPSLFGKDATEALTSTFHRVVERQLIADVPLGVFLSGGIDSPLVAAVSRERVGSALKAFTIGNPGWAQDEARMATAYAQHLGVDHRLQNTSGTDALETIPDVIAAQHEPFADFSIVPTLMVSRFARQEVTVSLSGDGGDELFFGYERPFSLLRNGNDFRWPWPIRIAMYAAGKYGVISKRSDVIVWKTPAEYYFNVNSRMSDDDLAGIAPDLPGLPCDFNLYQIGKYRDLRQLANYSRRVEYYGQLQRCLKKVDMGSMYHSLEVRVPFLDKDVLEVSLKIDPFECMRNGVRKSMLRDFLSTYVPPESIPKPKMGFAVPLGDWLRGPLRSLVEDTLFGSQLYPQGVFNVRGLRQYWEDHLSGRQDRKWGLWNLLVLQWWAGTHLPGTTVNRA